MRSCDPGLWSWKGPHPASHQRTQAPITIESVSAANVLAHVMFVAVIELLGRSLVGQAESESSCSQCGRAPGVAGKRFRAALERVLLDDEAKRIGGASPYR